MKKLEKTTIVTTLKVLQLPFFFLHVMTFFYYHDSLFFNWMSRKSCTESNPDAKESLIWKANPDGKHRIFHIFTFYFLIFILYSLELLWWGSIQAVLKVHLTTFSWMNNILLAENFAFPFTGVFVILETNLF